MHIDERIALLRSAQINIRTAIEKIIIATNMTETEDRVQIYTLLWLQKVVDGENKFCDIGNIDEIIKHLKSDTD